MKLFPRDVRFAQVFWPLPLQKSIYMHLSRSCGQVKMTPAALREECSLAFSQQIVPFIQVWLPQALKKWRYEHLLKSSDHVTTTSPASGKGCSLPWTYLNSCFYCPSLVTVALLENIIYFC